MDYNLIMQAALSLAKVAADKGDVPVGAIVVNEAGEILGTGQNLREQNNDPTAHAEIVALRNASEKFGSWRLDDLTIVVTLEPCAMCAGAILQSRIKRLVSTLFLSLATERQVSSRAISILDFSPSLKEAYEKSS